MVRETFGHVINGVEQQSDSGELFDDVNPWTEEVWAQIALGGKAEADAAVGAARLAFDEGPWPRMGFAQRGVILHRLADLMARDREALALADSRDMGKPLTQAIDDVDRSILNIRFFADQARLSQADAYPMDSGHHAYTRYEPAGVVVAIAPWNFPLMLETWKIAPALAWGNTVVLKPAEDTPASATMLARLAIEAGLPPGVLNVVHGFGPDSVGQFLTEDSRVDRITFTGESGTGRAISRAAAMNLTPVSLELGGKGANIVFEDADLDNAVQWAVQAIFRNAGQVCLAGSRLFVHRSVYDELLSRFAAAAESLKIGDPELRETEFSCLASREHFEKVTSYLDTVEAHGGTVVTGGVADSGLVVKPTIITGLGLDSPHYCEEIFGPVVVVRAFETEQEVVELANDSPYGLNAMVFTENLSRAHRVAARLEAGTVWVNCFFIRDLRAPFGGFGDSGVGREGGVFSRDFFTEPKAVIVEVNGLTE
jgi:aminomuconate-semialdehyde/2-hydroxymuconate-6-semialdehyde dehydrogenase